MLAHLAAKRSRLDARRLGWLLDLVRTDLDLTALRDVAQPDQGRPRLLAVEGARRGQHDERWGVIINATAEADDL